jgi:ATP-binding cassette, subfamily B, bacterial
MSPAERRAGPEQQLSTAPVDGAPPESVMRERRAPTHASLAEERRYSDRAIYRRVLSEARPFWGHIAAIFVLSLLATPLALLTPVPIKIAVDSVLGDKPLPGFLESVVPESLQTSTTGLLLFAVAMVVAVSLANHVRALTTNLLKTYTSECLTLRFRARLFRHAQRLAMAYHDLRGSSEANYRIQRDAGAMSSVAVEGVIPFISASATFLAMIVVIAAIDVVLALIAALITPVLAVLTWFYRRRLRHRHREVKALESRALGVVQEVLGSIRVVRAFGQEDHEERRYLELAGDGMRARLRVAFVDGSFLMVIGLVSSVGTAAVLFVGVRNVQAGTLTLGSLLLIMGYLAGLYGPLYTMSRQVATLQSGLASSERAFSLLDEDRDVPEKPDAKSIENARGHVVFDGVSFGYDPDRKVLEDVSFRVEAGMRIGIAGRTGSGKTTLMSLLTRFYDPTSGSITLDGVDLRDYRIADLRSQFAIVLQEPVLFSTTIGENIAYGRLGATADEIVAAARAAHVHDFVSALPDGYDTVVGERGMTLSGGERQRVSLARAFLKDAPILILDEPTSSVDVNTEATIIDAMERLMAGRTTFMIAHRLSTLEGCDLRLEIDDGRLVSVDAAAGGARRMGRRNGQLRSAPHPALAAWTALGIDAPSPETVEDIVRKKRITAYRLVGVPHREAAVIAKRQRRSFALHERRLYEHVLPHVSAPVPRYYGLVDDTEDSCWVFVEDVGGDEFASTSAMHGQLAARYLACVHTASGVPRERLADRGPEHYMKALRAGRKRIRANVDRVALDDEAMIMMTVAAHCSAVEREWPRIQELCDELPAGLVHCDFASKNMRIQRTNGHARLVAFDWEMAGWGMPGVDLFQLDDAALEHYGACVAPHWADVGLADLRRMRQTGRLFNLLASIEWATQDLAYEWLHRPLKRLRSYEPELRAALASLGSAA